MESVSGQLLDWSAASIPISGEEQSGDGHLLIPAPWGVLLAVVDGVGHGPDAADAAGIALSAIRRHADESLPNLLARCHESLQGSRGATLSVCAIYLENETMSWLGVGNVAGVLMRANPAAAPRLETLVPRSGLLGDQLPALSVSSLPLARGDTLVLATDGVAAAFTEDLSTAEKPDRLADRLLNSYRTGSDDALVVVARYVGVAG